MRSTNVDKVWVVRKGDGQTLGEIVTRAKEAPSAIDEGRVFVGKRRATTPSAPVSPGDVVRIGAPRARSATEVSSELEILLHEGGLIAVNKPAGLPTVPDHAGSAHALVALAAKTLGMRADALRITSRLDRGVSGVVLFALDEAAETNLKRARAEGSYHRRYVAIGCASAPFFRDSAPAPGLHGVWTRDIRRAAEPRLRAASDEDGKRAETRWRVEGVGPTLSAGECGTIVPVVLAVDPITGRTHQIRVHASDGGTPLLGDRDYGGPPTLVLPNGRVLALGRIALHAARVRVPGARGPIELHAPIPPELRDAWAALGGSPDAWGRAVAASST